MMNSQGQRKCAYFECNAWWRITTGTAVITA